MNPYEKMTQEDFNRILEEQLDKESGATLLAIPGIYEIVSEHFNNEVLAIWEEEQE